MSNTRLAERKLRDKENRRAQIVSAARRIAEAEGWPNVTVRRLADEIAYSQPVLYSHFENRDAILAAVAIEGFRELGKAMDSARTRTRTGSAIARVATAYLTFAASSPALYEVMFTLALNIPFGQEQTPPELHFAFLQFLALFPEIAAEGDTRSARFPDRSMKSEITAELFWASLHGTSEFMRTNRFPAHRQKRRIEELVGLFSSFGPPIE